MIEKQSKSENLWTRVSHDLRQPIQSLLLLSHVVASTDDRAQRQRAARSMEDSLLALQSMIENLATVAKLDAGTVRPVSAPTVLGPLVLAMAAAASAIDPHLKVETHIEPTSIFTDRVMLGKLTSWLAINTAHMARTGSIEFHCRQVGAGAHLECHYTAPPPVGTQLDGIFVEVKASAPTSLARSVVPGLGFCSTYARHLAAELGYRTETLDRQTICLKVHELDQVSPEG